MSTAGKPWQITDFTDVIVTGGSSGIGEAFLKSIATLNPQARLFNLSRTFPKNSFNEGSFVHLPCDLTRPEALEHAVAELRLRLENTRSGPLLLINNSGFGSYGPFKEAITEQQVAMISLNVSAPVHLTSRLLPLLRFRGGAVLNIASTASFQPTPYLSTYGATKAFLLNWSLAVGEELSGTNVHFLTVCPGPTRTHFFKAAGFDTPPLPDHSGQTAEAVVAESLRALEKGRHLVVTGWRNRLMTAFSGKFPKVFITRISGKILKRVRLQG